MNTNFALYRLPFSHECTLVEQTSGSPIELSAGRELVEQPGFVMAPFAPSDDNPILLIRPDSVKTMDFEEHATEMYEYLERRIDLLAQISHDASPSDTYHEDFQCFHNAITSGRFQKLVLSRSLDVKHPADACNPIDLFYRACAQDWAAMVALVCTERSGMWLTATPEILLSGWDTQWRTVALAGTMPYARDIGWGDKNIQEQRYVASFVKEELDLFAEDYREEGPYTVCAGHLAHLRSDFHFRLSGPSRAGTVVEALHPTPAVCGLPKYDALSFILRHEHNDRRFYSGFLGPFLLNNETHLFVNLRCMQIFSDHCTLYAGGGILMDSVEEQEWQETETKLDTMRTLLKS